MYSCVFKRDGAKHFKLYFYKTWDRYQQGLRHLEKFKNFTTIMNSGQIGVPDVNFFKSHADDWHSLEPHVKGGQWFALTEENRPAQNQPSIKTINNMAPKKKQLVHSVTGKEVVDWSNQELAILWSHTAEEVSKRTGRSVAAVIQKRRKWLKQNPGFQIPAEANFTPRPRAPKKNPNAKPRWTDDQIDLLWSGSEAKVAKRLGRTKSAVHLKRLEYLETYGNFVPPKEAKFKLPAKYQGRLSKSTVSKQAPAKQLAKKSPVQEVKNSATFKMKIGDKELELPEKPTKLKLGDMEIEF